MAEELDIQKHVLRFWESKFNQLKPMKRGGGRRYYRPEDVELLRGIHHLLRSQAYTIKGVQRILREHGIDFVKGVWQAGPTSGNPSAASGDAATQARTGRGAIADVAMDAPAGRTGLKAKRGATAGRERVSADETKALKGVVDQLEAARQSLAKTRKSVQQSTQKRATAASPKAKASSKRS